MITNLRSESPLKKRARKPKQDKDLWKLGLKSSRELVLELLDKFAENYASHDSQSIEHELTFILRDIQERMNRKFQPLSTNKTFYAKRLEMERLLESGYAPRRVISSSPSRRSRHIRFSTQCLSSSGQAQSGTASVKPPSILKNRPVT